MLKPSLPLTGTYRLPLEQYKLAKGDQVRLTVEAVDYRGDDPGKPTKSEPIVLQITDESGIMAALSETDRHAYAQMNGSDSTSIANRRAKMKPTRVRTTIAVGIALLIIAPTMVMAADSPLSPDALRAKQEMQQRARDMARELVSGILEVQLKQLEQNGLQKLDLYRDIQTMRKNIDVLVEAEMRDVVELLVQAQKADDPADPQRCSRRPAARFARS